MDTRIVMSGADLELVRTLFKEYADWVAVDLSFQGFEEELAGLPGKYVPPDGVLLLCAVDGGAAGCVAVRRFDADTCEMKRLFVRSAYRGRNCGVFLARQAIEWATAAGYARMVLDTLPTMGTAHRLYERLGFRDVAPYRFNPVPGTRFMALELGKA